MACRRILSTIRPNKSASIVSKWGTPAWRRYSDLRSVNRAIHRSEGVGAGKHISGVGEGVIEQKSENASGRGCSVSPWGSDGQKSEDGSEGGRRSFSTPLPTRSISGGFCTAWVPKPDSVSKHVQRLMTCMMSSWVGKHDVLNVFVLEL